MSNRLDLFELWGIDTYIDLGAALFSHACIIFHPCYGKLKTRDHNHANSGEKGIG